MPSETSTRASAPAAAPDAARSISSRLVAASTTPVPRASGGFLAERAERIAADEPAPVLGDADGDDVEARGVDRRHHRRGAGEGHLGAHPNGRRRSHRRGASCSPCPASPSCSYQTLHCPRCRSLRHWRHRARRAATRRSRRRARWVGSRCGRARPRAGAPGRRGRRSVVGVLVALAVAEVRHERVGAFRMWSGTGSAGFSRMSSGDLVPRRGRRRWTWARGRGRRRPGRGPARPPAFRGNGRPPWRRG